MKHKLLIIGVMLSGMALAEGQEPQAPQVLQTQKEKLSYGIGVNAARNFKSLELDLDIELLIRALRDVYSGNKLLLSEDELRLVLDAHQKDFLRKQAEAAKALADKNKKEGDAFLAENKTKEGVVTLASGLQYKILKAGEGKMPTESDTVQVQYKGTLIDGTEFDSSYKRGQPAAFPLKNIIAGWREALKLMPVGSRWQLFMPPELAYGTRGSGQIGPNATLIFEVELLAIQ